MALSHHIVPSYNLHAHASVEQLKALKETQLSSIDVEDNEQDINDLFRGGGPFPYVSHVDLEKESYELSCHAAVQNQTLLQKFQFQRTQLENQIPKDQAEDKTFQNFVRDISAHLRNEWLVSRSVLRLLQDLVEGVHYGSIFLQCKIKISPDSQTFSHGDTFYPDGEFDALILMGENGVIVRSVHKLIDGSLYDCMAEILEQRHGYEEQDEDYVYEEEEDVVMKDY
eukprot:CAMPEP_0202477554 /NCGR_PEP_ID=MMETSP1360-20130828/94004_1 /ASSEMBLY_ACC=CAM_ASM_000848 /TAXON_ID=515479 /ORGANISM="Licmophora paradoxa, Strain CCMP2313" /LENGTH=225 /DNA_ID=CAMNT_0049104803 /DNA_START=910 /DNA_END=1587 /DNA_ORIENTATION=+